MNMENFITGYPGHERQHREAMLEVLGQEKCDFFFDKFLECTQRRLFDFLPWPSHLTVMECRFLW
jgi:hypothetical protein